MRTIATTSGIVLHLWPESATGWQLSVQRDGAKRDETWPSLAERDERVRTLLGRAPAHLSS